MTDLNDKLRADFEAWARKENYSLERDEDGVYLFSDTLAASHAFKAARATPAPQAAPSALHALKFARLALTFKAPTDVQRKTAIRVIDEAISAAPLTQAADQSTAAVAEYKPGKWFDARTIDEMEAFYLSRLPAIREAAREHGYAIGVHGSVRRDFDLLAMPWREDAGDRDTLARAIADAACGIRREGAYDWEQKPVGRVATSIPICWTAHDNPNFHNMISAGHIDLSLIAATPAAPLAQHRIAELVQEIEQMQSMARRDSLFEELHALVKANLNTAPLAQQREPVVMPFTASELLKLWAKAEESSTPTFPALFQYTKEVVRLAALYADPPPAAPLPAQQASERDAKDAKP